MTSVRKWIPLALLGVTAAAALISPVDAARRHGRARQLFNGKDLTNFYTWLVGTKYEDPDRVFGVEMIDGVPAIRVTGRHYGAFITKEEFSDYHLVAEY